MKKKIVLLGLTSFFLFVAAGIFASEKPDDKKDLKMPENVKVIVERSCYGCHHTASRNEDAKKEFDFDKLHKLSKIKKIGKYKHISEVLEKNEMPPKKFLQRYPDRGISDEEKKILMDWAEKEAVSLVKK